MSFNKILLSLLLVVSFESMASTQYHNRGYLFARLSTYTESAKNYGQQTRGQIEQLSEFSENLSALNQLRWNNNSLNSDLSKNTSITKKETFEAYLGENFIKYKSEHWAGQFGYQEVLWGDAFGFNYADIITPKDQRETLYSDSDIARRPLLLANIKTFFSIGDFSGSLQALYSPAPSFSITLPIEVYAGNLFQNMALNLTHEKSPKFFKQSEFGGKASLSYSGLDFSIFGYSYLDREPTYEIESVTATSLNLVEKHNLIKTTGASLSKTLGDFVLRSDFVWTKDKTVNYILQNNLSSYKSDTLNYVISIDSPTYNDYSGVLIYASSNLLESRALSFRTPNEKYIIGKLTKNLNNDKTFEISYTQELAQNGRSIQTVLNWPVTNTVDLKLGGQFYNGEEKSDLNKFKNISSIFFSIKNYFQL